MKVDVAKDLPRPFDYKSCVESLPAAIVMNGFGQACATLLAKAGGASGDTDAHRLVYDHLEDWLCVCVAMGLKKPLMQAVVHSDQSKYCHAQAEALAYLVWLKKFAQAFLPRQAKGAGNGQD
jgi:CRISPR-associated protein Cmr5